MDKIFSTRMDEKVIQHVGLLAKQMGTSKKAVLENAIRMYAEKLETDQGCDILTHTFGGWRREESAAETVRSIKGLVRQSQERYKQ